jgi:hypothetical protein
MDVYISQAVNFTSGGTSYTGIQVYPADGSDYDDDTLVYLTSSSSSTVYVADWLVEVLTVDFGSTPQTVSYAFYSWFTSNATQLSSPDPNPDPDPDPDPGTHYSLTINIFNSTGTTLDRTFSGSSVSSPLSPTATMHPIAAG